MQQNLGIDRLIANDELETLNRDVRKFGKTLRSIVEFFVAFFLVALLNLCIDLFAKHTQLITADSFRLLEEGLRTFINQNVIAFVSIISEHNFFAAVAMAFACVFGATLIVENFVATHVIYQASSKRNDHKEFTQECATSSCVVAYKQKVCFLS